MNFFEIQFFFWGFLGFSGTDRNLGGGGGESAVGVVHEIVNGAAKMNSTNVFPSSIRKERKSEEKHRDGNHIGMKLSVLIPKVLEGILWIYSVN